MKKLVFTLVALGAAFSLASESIAQAPGPKGPGGQARPGGPGGPGGRQGGARMGGMRRFQELQNKVFAQLKLTPDQKKKIDALNKKTQTKREALMKSVKPGADRSAMRDKFRALQDDHRKEMNKILTPDQQKKFAAAWKAEMDKMRAQGGGPGRPGGAPGGPRPGGPRPGGPGGPAKGKG